MRVMAMATQTKNRDYENLGLIKYTRPVITSGVLRLLTRVMTVSAIVNHLYYLLKIPVIETRPHHIHIKNPYPYTDEALDKNPHLGWQPLLVEPLNSTSFSWASCFRGITAETRGGWDIDGSNQRAGCYEHPSELGGAPLSVNESPWVPDVTMLRTMLVYGKDKSGNSFPPQLSVELCKDFRVSLKKVHDTHKQCLREAKIMPTGALNSDNVTISPWNHFGVAPASATGNHSLITVPAPKVLCLIYTVKNAHSTRIRAIRETWAGGCDGFLAFSTKSDPRLPAIALEHIGPESYDNMWQKVRSIWKFVGMHYLEQFDWFYIGGDDMFVLPNNLRTYLASLAYKDGSDPRSKDYYVGRRQKSGTYFNTGGAGYALSQATLRKLLTIIDDDVNCHANETTATEDVMVGNCLNYLGIGLTDTRDANARERFHYFSPGTSFHFDKKASRGNKGFYREFSKEWGMKNGPDCCAPDSVSFHYVKQPVMMRHLQALLYHCKNH
ncbi:hypothetical protein ACHAXR_013065 [Thalassiosira sp. AJA248-18]